MRRWSNEARWVSDENGLRWYFSEPNPGGPSRLECYRRLLAEPSGPKRGRFVASAYFATYTAPLRRWTDLIDFARRGRQDQPLVGAEIGQEQVG
jgi:hypothetical protein